jgi:hypothetical protein
MADLLIALAEYCAEGCAKLLYFGSADSSARRWTWKQLATALLGWSVIATAVAYLVFF